MSEMDRLRQIMAKLRGPDGCPWDRQQTLATLATYVIEEAYEVAEAIVTGSPSDLEEELGDLLFQIVFQARVAEESGDFDLDSVMRAIGDKIIRRHPHVFGADRLETAEQVLTQWEQIKVEERREKRDTSMFSSVPSALPALLKALRVSSKAARVGFDWVGAADVMKKVDEEIRELRAALKNGRRAGIEEELGDLLFTIANVARHAHLDPEMALQAATRKFIERFRQVEGALREDGLEPAPEHKKRMERYWIRAKRALRRTSPGRTSPSAGTSGSAPRRARRAVSRGARGAGS